MDFKIETIEPLPQHEVKNCRPSRGLYEVGNGHEKGICRRSNIIGKF